MAARIQRLAKRSTRTAGLLPDGANERSLLARQDRRATKDRQLEALRKAVTLFQIVLARAFEYGQVTEDATEAAFA